MVGPPRLGLHAESDDSEPELAELRAAAEQIAEGTGADLLVSRTKELVGEELAESGVAGHPIMVNGNPDDVLGRHSVKADLLVLGSRGHNPLATLVVGSTSDYCARHAECPVMIVRPADHQEHDDTQHDLGRTKLGDGMTSIGPRAHAKQARAVLSWRSG